MIADRSDLGDRRLAERVATLRADLDHPVIDADGHWLEFVPALTRYMRAAGIRDADLPRVFAGSAGPGSQTWASLSPAKRARTRSTRPGWWGNPARNTLDLATAQLPRLLHARMDTIGLDVSVIYPSIGLVFPHVPEEALRRRSCRALNRYHADVFGDFADRLVPVAVVPMHTPQEAIEELEYAVTELGFKTILIAGLVMRPIEEGEGSWIDTFGIDSAYDYDPFWRRCVELRVPVAAHSFGMGWGSRCSISSYVYNHVGNFAAADEALCKSLFLGGVTRRFPSLRFAFLEGGAAWACALYNDLHGHWSKRGGDAVRMYDPAAADRDRFRELVGPATFFTGVTPESSQTKSWHRN